MESEGGAIEAVLLHPFRKLLGDLRTLRTSPRCLSPYRKISRKRSSLTYFKRCENPDVAIESAREPLVDDNL